MFTSAIIDEVCYSQIVIIIMIIWADIGAGKLWRCHPHLAAALQVQHQRLSLGYSGPDLGPVLPFVLHLQVATHQAVVPRERRLPLKMKNKLVALHSEVCLICLSGTVFE